MKTSESLANILPALFAAMSEINHAPKTKQNNHLKNFYAELKDVIDASKPILLKNKIMVIQVPGSLKLVTRLQHLSGEFIEGEMDLILSQQNMQQMGSALTYARRQALTAMLNMAQTDDDGQLASAKKAARPVPPKPAMKPNDIKF